MTMNTLKAPSLHSLIDSDHGSSNDSLLAESLQLDIEEVERTLSFFYVYFWADGLMVSFFRL